MNARQLEIFRAIVRDGSLTAAANSLNISQPAVSKTLRHLESQLGYALFERIGGRLVPTTEAQILFVDADRVFREMESLKQLAMTIRERHVGLLRIGASLPVTYALVSQTLARFRRSHEAVKVHLRSVPKEELAEGLLVGDIDLALTLSTIHKPTVRSQILTHIPVVAVMRDDDPLAERPQIEPCDLSARQLISYDGRANVTPDLRRAFVASGCTFDPAIHISTSIGALPLVRGGLGIALVDGLVPWESFPPLRAVAFQPRVEMTLAASTNSARVASRFVEPFLAELKVSLSEGAATRPHPAQKSAT
ncbi:LysR family transcriptional regulator [uncultured Aureimonas sp.]|uniref:LysR family transcriptional regulator n=1 Tax=uncultured Aureimonas sp. TaxID=1604662 RepID=UPI0025D1C78F|nr:LysR family transcriptional regulator [uncultured Aureimonas sp.]